MDSRKHELDEISEQLINIVSINVARIRQEKGYSQLKLALEIGLNGAAYLGRMETRSLNHRFNLEHLSKIAHILQVDICEFFKPYDNN